MIQPLYCPVFMPYGIGKKPCISLYSEGILVKNFTILWLLVQEESWDGKRGKCGVENADTLKSWNHSAIAIQRLYAV